MSSVLSQYTNPVKTVGYNTHKKIMQDNAPYTNPVKTVGYNTSSLFLRVGCIGFCDANFKLYII